MDTRPAMRDTRCREDRLRGRGDDGERERVGRTDPDGEEVRHSKGDTMKDSVVGVMVKVRAEKDVGVTGGIIGDELLNAWWCLGGRVLSTAYPNSEYGGADSSCSEVLSSLDPSQ
jgi:hypothetical protein